MNTIVQTAIVIRTLKAFESNVKNLVSHSKTGQHSVTGATSANVRTDSWAAQKLSRFPSAVILRDKRRKVILNLGRFENKI